MFGLGADEHDFVFLDDFRKSSIFRQEAIAGMDRISVADFRCRNDRRDVQIAIFSGRRADTDCFIREPDMHGVDIGGRMYRDGSDPHFVCRAVYAQRNFTAIGDEQLFDGHYSMTTNGWSNSTGWPLPTRICVTLPPRGAIIGFMTFIASMIRMVSPSLMLAPTATNGGASGSGAR